MQNLYWPFEDPAESRGTEEEQLQKFRELRDKIEARILNWLRVQQ
jgi:arsenate reductase